MVLKLRNVSLRNMLSNAMPRAVMSLVTIAIAPFIIHSSAGAATLLTFYCPYMDSDMEGGTQTVLGSRVVTLEESGRQGHLPTLASWNGFSGHCNNRPGANEHSPRCVVAISVPGLRHLPGYTAHVRRFRRQYGFLCENCDTVVGVVEDTGGAFNDQDKGAPERMFDLALSSSGVCNQGPDFRTSHLRWGVVGSVSGGSRPR